MLADGKLREKVLRSRLLLRPGEPAETSSEIRAYYDLDGTMVAKVHCYRRPNGTLGGSGLPDPKWLYIDGVVLYCA